MKQDHTLLQVFHRNLVEIGQPVQRGEVLTEGSIEPKNYLSVAGLNATESYLLKEVQKVYRMQGVEIDDKHVEVMVRQNVYVKLQL